MTDFTHEPLSFQEKIDLDCRSVLAIIDSRSQATAEAAKLEIDAMIVRYAQECPELESAVANDFYDIYRFSATGFERYVEEAFAAAAESILRTRVYVRPFAYALFSGAFATELVLDWVNQPVRQHSAIHLSF